MCNNFFLISGTDFQRAISDRECAAGSEVKRLVFCSGKVYYELVKERQDRDLTNQVAIVRIEQVRTVLTDFLIQSMCMWCGGGGWAPWDPSRHQRCGFYLVCGEQKDCFCKECIPPRS